LALRKQPPPVLLLGGGPIGLSIARSLAPLGVTMFALMPPNQPLQFSRHAQWIPLPGPGREFWERCLDFLTGPQSDSFAGAVLLPTEDEAVCLVTEHREALMKKFLLDRSNPRAQRLMLDKIGTYRAAREAGVPTPRFWTPRTLEELRKLKGELVFPLIVKPRFSHQFRRRFDGVRHFTARDFREAEQAFERAAAAGLETFLVEKIPGPDSLSSSYYTYLDEAGRARFHFTKRVLRRYPRNMGPTTAHVSDFVPDVEQYSLRLLRHIGLQGVANLEHKLDPRDGVRKLIECNARFSGGNQLVRKSGVNIAEVVYCEITGRPAPEFRAFRKGVRMWHPREDFAAFRELHSLGEITFGQWVASILHLHTFSVWSWNDPFPAVGMWLLRQRWGAAAAWRRLWRRGTEWTGRIVSVGKIVGRVRCA
jgi:D-aspartate ligase